MNTPHRCLFWRIFWVAALVLVGLASTAFAQDESDPPGRVAHLSFRQGGVVFAPQGEDEWIELTANRPITSGDRLWSDRGARAELQLGSATLHVDGESHLGVGELDERSAQFVLQQGTVNLRVRELVPGENIEIGTPNSALRATQPGDYRIEVDPNSGETRVQVRSGLASVFGEGGQQVDLGAGQQAGFAGRFLAQVQVPAFAHDDFAAWAAERNRAEDQSIAARHVPRGVVGYPQLDQHGSWGQDPAYGEVWYPRVTVQDWAPYRYGHWAWISPWGWTWIDDAPWGFAPFHYGRWTQIVDRWAWVPGRLAARPVYAPALVVFLGGGGTRISIASGPAVGWYPLAPGEAWWPVYRTTPRYVSYANHDINLTAYPRHYDNHVWRHRPQALTAVAEDTFRRGLPVYRHWQRLPATAITQAQAGVVPVRPQRLRSTFGQPPRLVATPPAAVQSMTAPRFWGGREAPALRDQLRAQGEQFRLQREAERAAREQQRSAEQARQQQDFRAQREQMLRQQQEQAARIGMQRQEQERARQQAQQEQAVRAQQEQAGRFQQERLQRAQQEQAARIQQEQAARAQQEQAARAQQDQAARIQQERVQRDAWRARREQEREQRHVRPAEPPRQQVQVPQQQVQPVQQPQQAAPVGRGRGEGNERRRERGDDDRPGPGHGRWNR